MNSALLLAAGSGQRMQGAVEDKVLAPLLGKAALTYSLEAFLQSGSVANICIVYRDAPQREKLEQIVSALPIGQIQFFWTNGGKERQDSVLRGLDALPSESEVVLIHDCARPLISATNIRRIADAAKADGAACLAHPVADTIKRIPQAGQIEKTELEDLERDRLWAMETPQAFHYQKILTAYQHVKSAELRITDDTAAAATIGLQTTLVQNNAPNPKITTAADLNYIEWLLTK